MGLNYLLHFLSSFVSNHLVCFLLLRHIYAAARKNADPSVAAPIALSRDLLLMLFISQVQRVYWSFSPPAIWDVPLPLFSWSCFIETITAPFCWLAVLYAVRKDVSLHIVVPYQFQWLVLTMGAFIAAFIWHNVGLAQGFTDPDGYPIAIEVAMSSHILDGFAIIPQLYHLAQGNKKAEALDTTGERVLNHFVALLSIGRAIRMVSWAFHIHSLYSVGMLSWDIVSHQGTRRVLLFIAPDLVHTILMGDYLYLWFRALKQQTVDPWLEQISMIV